jgi:hypothetical protein
MSDEADNCEHRWGEAELCETSMGNVTSPTCRDCGAVKIVVESRRVSPAPLPSLRQILGWVSPNPTPAGAPVQTNIPPPGVTVQKVQLEFFTDL